jgi:hypothetical protein
MNFQPVLIVSQSFTLLLRHVTIIKLTSKAITTIQNGVLLTLHYHNYS